MTSRATILHGAGWSAIACTRDGGKVPPEALPPGAPCPSCGAALLEAGLAKVRGTQLPRLVCPACPWRGYRGELPRRAVPRAGERVEDDLDAVRARILDALYGIEQLREARDEDLAAIDFCDGVQPKLESMRDWIDEHQRVTPAMAVAIANMAAGVERWLG
jgi:hypothetical protein